MKHIVLSFDDSRSDFYTRAFPLLKKYKLNATLNVITGFINNPRSFPDLLPMGAMTAKQIIECYDYGIEIALHGDKHISESEDLLQNIEILNSFGVCCRMGFASPNSELTFQNKNEKGVWDLYKSGKITYVRSGFQVRREGLFYIIITLLDMYLKLPCLYRWLNKKAIIREMNEKFLPSATVFSYTTNNEIEAFIESMPDNTSVILMFHSILSKEDNNYGRDKWYWDSNRFDKLLNWLSDNREASVCTTQHLVEKII